jgi:hypothetical protein
MVIWLLYWCGIQDFHSNLLIHQRLGLGMHGFLPSGMEHLRPKLVAESVHEADSRTIPSFYAYQLQSSEFASTAESLIESAFFLNAIQHRPMHFHARGNETTKFIAIRRNESA